MRIELREYSNQDLWLTRALELNPEVMKDLGGPASRDIIRSIHRRRLKSVLCRAAWYFTIIPDGSTDPVGTIGIWESNIEDMAINEIGWMVLPAFQGHGYATEAGRAALERARFERRWRVIHALPSVSNGASNAICRKLGFTLRREVELYYHGKTQMANDWCIELFSDPYDM